MITINNFYLIILLICFFGTAINAFRNQAAGVRGILFCGNKPASGMLVKLFDEDDGPDPDDELDSAYTDSQGRFELSGSTMELTNIDPELRIYHDCNIHIPLCKREWVIRIPDKYINSGTSTKRFMELGVVNLEKKTTEMAFQFNYLIFLIIIFTTITILFSSIVPEQHSGIQSYKVKGRLMCGNQPAANVRVKLVDDDFGPDPDDDMDSGYTDTQGNFQLSGDTTELTTIDPHLKIYHDCNDGLIPCQRRWKFELPNHYITSGKHPHKTLDIGTWNLEAKMPGESHDCIH